MEKDVNVVDIDRENIKKVERNSSSSRTRRAAAGDRAARPIPVSDWEIVAEDRWIDLASIDLHLH